MSSLFIGLMSGTSINAVDAALVDLNGNHCELLATHSEPISRNLKEKILQLSTPGKDHIQLLGETDVLLGRLFAQTALSLLAKTSYQAEQIQAIGSHGQTIRHIPSSVTPFTLQIGDPNIIAATTNITTIADFRRRDMALSGQGAPLTPAFHAFLLRKPDLQRYVVNLGGIANLTLLPGDPRQPVIGYDTGPGNMLLDLWCQQHLGREYDESGNWAASGKINPGLLKAFLRDPYFSQALPKSTGRERFNQQWLEKHLNLSIAPADVQATLTELTAISIANAIKAHPPTNHAAEIWLCGGGCFNQFLVQRIQHHCENIPLQTTTAMGIDPQWIEAVAFAWLAQRTLTGQPGNLPDVTGASNAAVLGAIYR